MSRVPGHQGRDDVEGNIGGDRGGGRRRRGGDGRSLDRRGLGCRDGGIGFGSSQSLRLGDRDCRDAAGGDQTRARHVQVAAAELDCLGLDLGDAVVRNPIATCDEVIERPLATSVVAVAIGDLSPESGVEERGEKKNRSAKHHE